MEDSNLLSQNKYIKKNESSMFDLTSEDGLANRKRLLNSNEDRWEAFKKKQIKNNDVLNEQRMTITPLTKAQWMRRLAWKIITLGGLLTLIFDAIYEKFYLVTALIFTGFVFNVRDLFNDLWDDSPDLNHQPFHWGGMLLVLLFFNGIILIVSFLQWVYETSCSENRSRLRRLRRARFKQIEEEQRKNDKFSRSFFDWYNDIYDDPDVAITVFRNSSLIGKYWWYERPNKIYLPAPDWLKLFDHVKV